MGMSVFALNQTFKDFCRIPMGKPLVGSVVSHRRKSGWGLVTLSRDFSRSFSHLTRRWQFCSISHCPRATAVSSSCRASCTNGERREELVPKPRQACTRPETRSQPPKSEGPPLRSRRSRSYRGPFEDTVLEFRQGRLCPLGWSQPGR